jgi:hypothetical protein
MIGQAFVGKLRLVPGGCAFLAQNRALTAPATSEADMEQAACSAFVAAYLLTADVTRAESAVLKSIGLMNAATPSGEELFQGAVNAATERDESTARCTEEPEPAFSKLPSELQRVLQLAHRPRQCFVLRMLIGLSRDVCASLLNFSTREVDRWTSAAMVELAGART